MLLSAFNYLETKEFVTRLKDLWQPSSKTGRTLAPTMLETRVLRPLVASRYGQFFIVETLRVIKLTHEPTGIKNRPPILWDDLETPRLCAGSIPAKSLDIRYEHGFYYNDRRKKKIN